MKVRVSDVMVVNPAFCQPQSNLAEVAGMMWDEGCGALPVVDSAGNVTGMITDRDICIALGTRNSRASDMAVQDVSPARYFACAPAEDIHSAVKTMAAQGVRRLPVVDKTGKLSGVLSIDDVILHSNAGSEINFTQIVTALKAICAHRALASGDVAAVA